MAAAAGGWHSAAVGEDGSLFVWGSGVCGQSSNSNDNKKTHFKEFFDAKTPAECHARVMLESETEGECIPGI